MPIRVEMPRLSDTMEEGTLLKWRVKVGDKVSPGDVLADVETDKATMELAAYEDGTIAKLVAAEGATMPIGKLILVMAKAGEKIEDAAAAAGDAAAPAASKPKAATAAAAQGADKGGGTAVLEAPPTPETPTAPKTEGRLRVSPLAKKMAKDANIEVAALQGTGPDGRIIKRDIEAAVAAGAARAAKPGAAAPGAGTKPAAPTVKLESKLVAISGMRKTIAKRLVESKQTIPHFQVTMTLNADPLMQLRSVINTQLESQGVKLSVNDFVVKATAVALTKHPVVNSSWTDGGIQYHGTVNIGVAVALPEERGGGLVVPTLYNTHTTDLRTISAETKRLAKKARETGLTVDEMSNGTFTISNLGMFGVDHFTAIINPPQAAILAVGAGVEKAVVRGGKIVIGQEMSMTLSADHRVVDGASAAQFLVTIKELLENPAVMLV